MEYTNSLLDYKPHCTIAYLKKGAKERHSFVFDEFNMTNRQVWITDLTFSSKTGTMENVPLTGQVGRFRTFVEEKRG